MRSPRPLRLGLVGPVPPPNGGMAMQTRQLAQLLGREGVQVELVATNAPYQPAFIGAIPGLRALCRLLPYLYRVWRLAARVDVIHLMANSGWSWQLFAAPVLWLAWLRATPVIVNYRGGEAQTYFRQAFARVKPSLQKAAVVVVPSGYLEEVFAQFGQRTEIIPNIIDRDIFRPAASAAPADATERVFTLVITRNLEPIYAIDTAIRALPQVLGQGLAVHLRIAGSGPEESALRALANSLGVAAHITFEGRLERAAIASLYASADAAINTSTVDNMPNSVIEALACGVPVISTHVGGVPFIVKDGHTALLFPPGDDAALAAAIVQLHNNADLRAQLRSNGLHTVEQYTWPRVRQQWLDLYTRLCPPAPGESA